mmetsp:Transcript_28706/g.54249  ORF Transcript_28706/g.54249 Transcript_28706/m.54249 type:complete len:616 (+) Transcript_28706:72-1919(+)
MMILRTWADVLAFDGGPTDAEQQLADACKAGEQCELGDGTCPTEPSEERTIRAEVLRYLILGGCPAWPVDGRGVNLMGGYISGILDIDYGTAKGATQLRHCHFDSQFDAVQTRFEAINFNDSTLMGLNAQGAEIKGSVYLRRVSASETVTLNRATIGGQLNCTDAKLNATKGLVLNIQDAKIKGSVFLSKTTAKATIDLNNTTIGGQLDCTEAKFYAAKDNAINAQGADIKGSVYLRRTTAAATFTLNRATIGGQLDCTGAELNAAKGPALNAQGATIKGDVFLDKTIAAATVTLNGTTIGGQLDCTDAQLGSAKGYALDAQSVVIKELLIWRAVTITAGEVTFDSARASVLADDVDSWPGDNTLDLDGFDYDRITGAPTDAKTRLPWLVKGSNYGGYFYPQPYTQLAKVLRAMGHDAEARKVLAERERLVRIDERKQRVKNGGILAYPTNGLFLIGDIVLRYVAGYGHHPFRSLAWLIGLWLVAVWLSHMAWSTGDFAPASAVLQAAPEWQELAAKDKAEMPNPALEWSTRALIDGTRTGYKSGQDWETFSSHAYAADVVIPIINLGQTDTWGPSTERGDWGRRLWRYGFFLQIGGWIVTALGAAAITGIIRRD